MNKKYAVYFLIALAALSVGFAIGFLKGETIYNYVFTPPFSDINGSFNWTIFWTAFAGVGTIFLGYVALRQNKRLMQLQEIDYKAKLKIDYEFPICTLENNHVLSTFLQNYADKKVIFYKEVGGSRSKNLFGFTLSNFGKVDIGDISIEKIEFSVNNERSIQWLSSDYDNVDMNNILLCSSESQRILIIEDNYRTMFSIIGGVSEGIPVALKITIDIKLKSENSINHEIKSFIKTFIIKKEQTYYTGEGCTDMKIDLSDKGIATAYNLT